MQQAKEGEVVEEESDMEALSDDPADDDDVDVEKFTDEGKGPGSRTTSGSTRPSHCFG